MIEIHLVVTIKNNILENAEIFHSLPKAEESFAQEFHHRGTEPTDSDFENGYGEFKDGTSVCISSGLIAEEDRKVGLHPALGAPYGKGATIQLFVTDSEEKPKK